MNGSAHPAANWRPFLRALAEEVDALGGPDARDALLREVGRRIAQANPMPGDGKLDALTLDINELWAGFGWGNVTLRPEADRAVLIDHSGLPQVGGAGEPPGTWLSAVLEGVYETWLAALPNADAAWIARRVRIGIGGGILLRYGPA